MLGRIVDEREDILGALTARKNWKPAAWLSTFRWHRDEGSSVALPKAAKGEARRSSAGIIGAARLGQAACFP